MTKAKVIITDYVHDDLVPEREVLADVADVVALNAALVLWAAGIEDDLHKGFNKALFSINQGNPWEKFLLLRTYLASDE